MNLCTQKLKMYRTDHLSYFSLVGQYWEAASTDDWDQWLPVGSERKAGLRRADTFRSEGQSENQSEHGGAARVSRANTRVRYDLDEDNGNGADDWRARAAGSSYSRQTSGAYSEHSEPASPKEPAAAAGRVRRVTLRRNTTEVGSWPDETQ